MLVLKSSHELVETIFSGLQLLLCPVYPNNNV